jgi:hypothetical protein
MGFGDEIFVKAANRIGWNSAARELTPLRIMEPVLIAKL